MNVVENAAVQLDFDGHSELARQLREHFHNPLDHIFVEIYKNQREAWKQLEASLLVSYEQAIRELDKEKQNV